MVKLSLISRQNETFAAYLSGPIGSRFYSKEFLDGICQRRNEINSKLAKSTAVLVALTTALAFFDTLSGSISVASINLPISKSLSPALAVLVGAALLNVVFAMLDQLIVDRCINTIGNQVHLYSFNLYLLDRTAINLWSDAITPRFFGPRSRGVQKAAVLSVGVTLMIVAMAMGLLYPLVICGMNFVKVVTKPDAIPVEYFLSIVSLALCVLALSFALLFSVKFRFDPAHLREDNGQPTEEFKKQLEIEAAQQTQSAHNQKN